MNLSNLHRLIRRVNSYWKKLSCYVYICIYYYISNLLCISYKIFFTYSSKFLSNNHPVNIIEISDHPDHSTRLATDYTDYKCWDFHIIPYWKGLPQNEMTLLFSYFDRWHNAPLRCDKHRPRNWVFPTLKVKKPRTEWGTPFRQCTPFRQYL